MKLKIVCILLHTLLVI